MKAVLVTGGTGFIGRHVVKRLLAAGRVVYVTGREAVPDGAEHAADDFQRLSYPFIAANVETVIHLAAITDTRAPDAEQWNVNGEGAADFLLMCRESDVKRLVYASSCAVYGKGSLPFRESQTELSPLNAYGAAKRALDRMVSAWSVGLRFSNVFGPGEEHKGTAASMVSQIVAAVRAGKPVDLYPRCQRDIIDVDSVADAVVLAERLPHGVYNVSTNTPVDYRAVVEEAGKLLGVAPAFRVIDNPRPVEFQECTAAHFGKLATAAEEIGARWVPRHWREALAEYVAAGFGS